MEVEIDLANKTNQIPRPTPVQSIFSLQKGRRTKNEEIGLENKQQVISPHLTIFKWRKYSQMPAYMQRAYLKMKSIYSEQTFSKIQIEPSIQSINQVCLVPEKLQEKQKYKQINQQQIKRPEIDENSIINQSQQRSVIDSRMHQQSQNFSSKPIYSTCSPGVRVAKIPKIKKLKP